MEMRTFLGKMARKELMKQGKFWRLFQSREGVAGYRWMDKGIEVYFRNVAEPFFVPFSVFPYTETELNAFHRVRYVTDHPSAKKKVKRAVHCINVWNDTEELTIETTNPNALDEIKKQFAASGYLQDRCLVYGQEDTAIQITGVIQAGYSYGIEKRVFENIVAYSQFKETVAKGPREW